MVGDDLFLFIAIGIIVLFCIVEAIRLTLALNGIKRRLGRALSRASRGLELVEVAHSDDVLGPLWDRYRRSFIALSGPREKTDSAAAIYFNDREILAGRINLRYWMAVPNFLIGMGILGTFIGLTFGIYSFETGTVEEVRSSISVLLGGMATAFSTSIAGMLLSIAFNIYEKNRFRSISDAARRLAHHLDQKYLLSTADKLQFQAEDQAALLKGIFGYRTDDGFEVLPAHVLRDIRDESRKHSQALQSFATDLAEGIMLSTHTIEALGMNIGAAFQSAMQAKLGPAIEGVQKAVEELRDEKSSTNEDLVKDVVAELQEALNAMGSQFQEALSGGAVEHLEELARSVGATQGAMAEMPNVLRELMDTLRADLIDTSVRVGEESELATAAIRQEMERAVTGLGEAVTHTQDRTAELLQRQNESTEALTELVVSLSGLTQQQESAADQVRESLQSVRMTLGRFMELHESLTPTSRAITESGQLLRESTAEFVQGSERLQEVYADNLKGLRLVLEDVKGVARDYASQFDTIRTGLQGIFEQIQSGLTSYQNETSKSLNKYLGDFASQLAAASSALSGSVSALSESLEDLNDFADSIGTMSRQSSNSARAVR